MLASSLFKGSSHAVGAVLPAAAAVPSVHRLGLLRQLSVSAGVYSEPAPMAGSGSGPRTYTQYCIYKGKAAVAFKVIAPTFRPEKNDGFGLDREGVVLLEFAQVMQNQGTQASYGARNYDWKNKVLFGLKALELAALTDLDNLPDPNKGVELFHDPNKGNPDQNAAKISKSLKFGYAPQGEGYLLSINQKIGGGSSFMSVPITRPEYVVLKHLAAYLVPRLYGFDYLFEGAGATPFNLVEAPVANANWQN